MPSVSRHSAGKSTVGIGAIHPRGLIVEYAEDIPLIGELMMGFDIKSSRAPTINPKIGLMGLGR
jgi:hypothetical protein